MYLFESVYLSPSASTKLINATLFNIGWMAIILAQSSLYSPVILATFLTIHFALIGSLRREWKILCCVSLFGLVVDQAFFASGILTLQGQVGLAPLWLSCLWPLLATTLLCAFHGLRHRPLLASILGSVGGALSYIAGTRLTGIEFSSEFWGPIIMAAFWAVTFPMLLKFSGWVNREEALSR